jgi:hypothetical protein
LAQYYLSKYVMRNWIKLVEGWNTENWWEPKLDREDHPDTGDKYFQRFGVPAEVESRYSNAQCTWLALAMAQRFGWEIRAEMMNDEPTHIAHAYCVMPDGREVDILGPQVKVDSFEGGPVKHFTIEEMLEWLKWGDREAQDPVSFEEQINDARKAVELFIAPKV